MTHNACREWLATFLFQFTFSTGFYLFKNTAIGGVSNSKEAHLPLPLGVSGGGCEQGLPTVGSVEEQGLPTVGSVELMQRRWVSSSTSGGSQEQKYEPTVFTQNPPSHVSGPSHSLLSGKREGRKRRGEGEEGQGEGEMIGGGKQERRQRERKMEVGGKQEGGGERQS